MSELTVPTKQELESYNVIAKIASNNPFWKKLGGGGDNNSVVMTILSVILLGRELGLPPMFTVSGGINNIQGKFELSARAMNMLIRKHGHKLHIKVQSESICTIYGQRKDTGEEAECSFTIEEADKAGLIKQGKFGPGAWMTVPSDMLFARTISRLTRRLFPDCIGGCYVEGEILESVEKGTVETIDMPLKEEIIYEPIVEAQSIELQLPNDVDPSRVEMFIVESARSNNVDIDIIRRRACKNLDAMLHLYRAWEKKQVKMEMPVAN